MADGRWSGFYRLSAGERLAKVAAFVKLGAADKRALASSSALSAKLSATFIENSVGSFPLPLGFAVGFTIDGKDTVIPMAVEESSVVAAASHGAKMAAVGGGFTTEAMPPVTIGQVELRDVPMLDTAKTVVAANAAAWMRALDATIPSMVKRGGGLRGIEARTVGHRLVVHLHVDTRDAMGANVVNTICEVAAPIIQKAVGGRVGLRILSNLATKRLVTARCRISAEVLGGVKVVQAIIEANDFALADLYRAATHNKGIMNGIEPVAIATGNDWRAISAGAHAFAAMDGHYRGLTRYRKGRSGDLEAELTLPLAVGTVGGVTRLHPTARACLVVLGNPDAVRLARIMAAVGLAQNVAALRALATDGIQRGHMALHDGNRALRAGQKARKPTPRTRAKRKAKNGVPSRKRRGSA